MSYLSDKNLCERFANLSQSFDSLLSQSDSQRDSVQFLQNRCQTLEHILCYSEISPMHRIISDFKSISDFYLRQLAKEVEIYRLSSDERSQLLEFLNYLHSATREIEDMLLLHH